MASLTRPGSATGRAWGGDDVDHPVERGEAEDHGRFGLSLIYGQVGGADDFGNHRGVVKGQGDEYVGRERPAVGADVKGPDDDRQHEVHQVQVQNERHGPVIGQPYFADLVKNGHFCDADHRNQGAEEKAEDDGGNDDFYGKGQGRGEPWKEAQEIGNIKGQHFIPLPVSTCAGGTASSFLPLGG